jgi:hypothetical protein
MIQDNILLKKGRATKMPENRIVKLFYQYRVQAGTPDRNMKRAV